MPDDRFVIILDEARRALDRQEAAVAELRERAATLLSAGAISAAFLGGLVFTKEHHAGAWAWTSVVSFALLGCAVAAVLWPRRWHFVSNPEKMVETYVTKPPTMDIDQMRWHLAGGMHRRYLHNERKRRWMRWEVEAAVLLTVVEVGAFLVELADW
jgi:hypothetical protein